MRLRGTPRTYIADAGIALASLGISSFEALASPQNATTYAAIWKSVVLAHLRAWHPSIMNNNIYFHCDKQHGEIGFILSDGQRLFAIECATSPGAHMSPGFCKALEKLRIPEEQAFVVAPFAHRDNAGDATTLPELHSRLDSTLRPSR